jgi:hypothetical protein
MVNGVVEEVPKAAYGVEERMQRCEVQLRFSKLMAFEERVSVDKSDRAAVPLADNDSK